MIDEKISLLIFKSDENRLNQILLNLLSNAIKFTMPEGEITFEVKYLEEINEIYFSVTDSGIGIKEED